MGIRADWIPVFISVEKTPTSYVVNQKSALDVAVYWLACEQYLWIEVQFYSENTYWHSRTAYFIIFITKIVVRHNFDKCLKYLPYGIYERDYEDYGFEDTGAGHQDAKKRITLYPSVFIRIHRTFRDIYIRSWTRQTNCRDRKNHPPDQHFRDGSVCGKTRIV